MNWISKKTIRIITIIVIAFVLFTTNLAALNLCYNIWDMRVTYWQLGVETLPYDDYASVSKRTMEIERSYGLDFFKYADSFEIYDKDGMLHVKQWYEAADEMGVNRAMYFLKAHSGFYQLYDEFIRIYAMNTAVQEYINAQN